jgi:hypothetical protein
VVVAVKCLKVLATCREIWVSGKPSNQSARKVDSSPTTRLLLFIYTHRRVGVCSAEQTGIRSLL